MVVASRKLLLVFLCGFIFAGVAVAQNIGYSATENLNLPATPGRLLESGTSQLGIWAGYSSDNPTLVGRTTDRPYFELNLQYALVLTTSDSWALKYTAEIIPVAIIKQPPQGYTMSGSHLAPVDLPGSKQDIYGFGVTPVGLQMNFRRGYVLQPYINGTAGAMYFEDQVPVAGSSKFNFALGLGAGIEIWYGENQSIILGYKYHHISNGYTARQNPGVDSNLFYLGCEWSWKH